MPGQKQGKRSRKQYRNLVKCNRYKAEGRRVKNKVRKLKKLFKKQPNNKQLLTAINVLIGS